MFMLLTVSFVFFHRMQQQRQSTQSCVLRMLPVKVQQKHTFDRNKKHGRQDVTGCE